MKDNEANWINNLFPALDTEIVLLLDKVLAVLAIIVVAVLALKVLQKIIHRFFLFTKMDEQKEQTLETMLFSASRYVIYTLAVLMVLKEFVGDITPIIASAGVLGLAVSFGAQSLIKDIITGFFIIFEDQFHVGDFVEINEAVSGTIEELGLRMTTIREWSGKKFYISNSEIKTVRNYNRKELRAIVTATFPFEENPEKVRQVLEDVCREMEKEYYESFLQNPKTGKLEEPPQVYGVTDIDNSDKGAQFTIISKTKPASIWTVEKTLKEKIWQHCTAHGIRLAYPVRIYEGSLQETIENRSAQQEQDFS